MKKDAYMKKLWRKHGEVLRDPHEIFAGAFSSSGINRRSLAFTATASFSKIVERLGITLLVSREYENLLLALSFKRGKILQSFFHVPHPSGTAVDKHGSVYVATTRNPNQILEFRPTKNALERWGIPSSPARILVPSRSKHLAGAYYLHDLAFIGNKLCGNAVGINSVVEIDMNRSDSPRSIWWPKCIERNGKPLQDANYIQLNSIAAGKTLSDSFFSASGDCILSTRPGNPAYSVDGTGVIFSGKTRTRSASGLTRPHSARFHGKKLIVANSGYGEVGVIENGAFSPRIKLPGWTRGLCILKNVLFVGVSHILPRFYVYAPGVDPKKTMCGIFAISLSNWKVLGSIKFPYGNQIFAIESISSKKALGFPYVDTRDGASEQATFLTFQV